MSATNAPPLNALEGSPCAGFVLWQVETFPPSIVAQEVQQKVTHTNIAISIFLLNNFFIVRMVLFAYFSKLQLSALLVSFDKIPQNILKVFIVFRFVL